MFITSVKDTGDKLFSSVNDTGEKFYQSLSHEFSVIAGVADTGDKFIAGDNDTHEQLSPVTMTQAKNLLLLKKYKSLLSPVSLTPLTIFIQDYLREFLTKFIKNPNGILKGPGDTDL
jgi:hypothetical protein